MGCASSKIDDSDAVALCRRRVGFLDDALRHRYALADAHLAYLHSLKSVGDSLHFFFHSAAAGDLASFSVTAPPSPLLNLPHHRKGLPEEEEDDSEVDEPLHHLKSPESMSPSHNDSGHHLSHSSSGGSHIHFGSDSGDDELSGSESFHQLHHPPPSSSSHPTHVINHEQGMYENHGGMGFNYNNMYGSGGFTTTHMNFMRKQPTPSVSYHQKPVGTESIQMGMANPNPYPYYMANQNPNPNPYYYGDSYYGGGMGGGFFGGPSTGQGQYSSPPRQTGGGPPPPKQPPPPPPPPSVSTWDFLNPFESIEASYPVYNTPSRGSRDSREVREEEGIPELEEEDYEHEVVKEVYVDRKMGENGGGSSSSGGFRGHSKAAAGKDEIGAADEEVVYKPRLSASPEVNPVEYEVHMVDKKVVGEEGRKSGETSNVGAFKGREGGFRNVSEVVKEIQVQFDRASASGGELATVLEVGKLPFNRKNTAYQVSSKMLSAIAPSMPSSSRDSEASSSIADVDEDMGLRSRNLSSTLQKLYLWEKKLFHEVKIEEKMRVEHDKKVEKLRRLVERGAEPQKIDAARTAIKSLSTKITISIQIIDKISVKISRLRDEDLWLQLNGLIQGFSRMWKAMLDCHQHQLQAVEGARGLDAIAHSNHSSDTHSESVLQLEHELINWTTTFANWINIQKAYVKSINNWLLQCIDSKPEETSDGFAPFSPGRAGAPPVFVICYQWAQSLDRVSESEVVDSMRVFTAMIFQFREQDRVEMRQRMAADKDAERRLKEFEREDMKIQKQLQALALSESVVYQSDALKKTSLQEGLQHIFEAMERFTSESLKVYEELISRCEDVVGEHSEA